MLQLLDRNAGLGKCVCRPSLLGHTALHARTGYNKCADSLFRTAHHIAAHCGTGFFTLWHRFFHSAV